MVILDAAIVNVALPSIERDLDFSTQILQWVVSACLLTFGGLLLLGGRAASADGLVAFTEGFQSAFAAIVVFLIVALVVALLLLGPPRSDQIEQFDAASESARIDPPDKRRIGGRKGGST